MYWVGGQQTSPQCTNTSYIIYKYLDFANTVSTLWKPNKKLVVNKW